MFTIPDGNKAGAFSPEESRGGVSRRYGICRATSPAFTLSGPLKMTVAKGGREFFAITGAMAG
jgi:hypothetical protein